jgi:putative phosphoribosyl transferase
MSALFADRAEAGSRLAKQLAAYAGRPDVVVLALPRGGLPVAEPVAAALGAPLDVLVVRKLGVPGHEELAMGAIVSGGGRVLNESVLQQLDIPDVVIDTVAAREEREMARREHAYRGDRPPIEFGGKTVIIVDDGLATGATMRAAVAGVRQRRPARIVVAIPVAAADACAALRREADEVICVAAPESFFAVGQWYDDFSQTTDAEVHAILSRAGTSGSGSLARR